MVYDNKGDLEIDFLYFLRYFKYKILKHNLKYILKKISSKIINELEEISNDI